MEPYREKARVRNFFEKAQQTRLVIPGIACLLVGILLPTSKLHHQALILLLWVPGLVLLWGQRREAGYFTRCMLMYSVLAFLLWSLLSVLWSAADDAPREAKYLLFIVVSLWAFMLLGGLPERVLLNILWYSAALVGVFAIYSWLKTYLLDDMPWRYQISAGGQLDHSILAAHVFGFFMLVLYNLRPKKLMGHGCWFLLLSGFAAYLLFAQSKGVWLALLASVLLTPLWRPERIYKYVAGACVLAVGVFFIVAPDVLTQRGLSYRPELVVQGLQLYWSGNELLGLGLGERYSLYLDSIGMSFDHPHNLYLGVLIQVGAVGFFLWCLVWGSLGVSAWQRREFALGSVVLGAWVFASVALLSDGFYVWDKPRDVWFTTWIPIGLALALWRLSKAPKESLQ